MKINSWRAYPIALLGFDIRRWESEDPSYAAYFNRYIKKFLVYEKQEHWGPTHLQYHSPWGFLLTWPLCFHFWYQFREQKEGQPGTEKVLYVRLPGFRWDAGDDCYIVTKGYIGLHWD